jgi:hypothetical protein
MTILSLFIISGFIVTSGRPNINPVISSVVSEVGSFFRKDYGIERISMNREPVKSSGYADSVNPSTDTIPPINSPYKKIIVLVMESISYDEFFNHGKNDQQGDRNRIFDNCLQYTNYYTNNLDSYTSLIAMLHSTFVPFQAYVDESRYKFVNERNNLVRIFKQNGYRTLFLTSYGEQQKRFIPALKEWDEVVCMKQFPDNFVKVTSNKIESASEDRAVFGDLIRFVRDHDQAFVFQEMVYGHTAEWKSKTGIGTLDYYRQYFQALNDTLAASNLLEGSLIVITSDHGPRQDAQLAANYHVPLMLLTARPENTRVTSLCSHLDFREILLGVMSGKPMDIGRQKIWTVGNSGDYIYGMIGSAGQYVFVDNRTLSVESNMPEQEVRSFTVDFQQYVVHFSGELKVGKL